MKILTKYIFEKSDFRNCGELIVHCSSPQHPLGKIEDVSFLTSVAYKVCYCPYKCDDRLLISLADGMIMMKFANIEKLIDHLNHDAIGYRPLSFDEMSAINKFQGNRF